MLNIDVKLSYIIIASVKYKSKFYVNNSIFLNKYIYKNYFDE